MNLIRPQAQVRGSVLLASVKRAGFTIVELLIVIVVIAILATITVVSYNTVTDKANDASVQSDIKNIAQQLTGYCFEKGSCPRTGTDMKELGIKVSKDAYGEPYTTSIGGAFNGVFCFPRESGGRKFSIIASSKSGKVFKYNSGQVSEYTGRWGQTASEDICRDAGSVIDTDMSRLVMWSGSGGWVDWVNI